MSAEPCVAVRRGKSSASQVIHDHRPSSETGSAVTTYDFQSPPYVGSLTRPSNPNLPQEITMRDLAVLTVTHRVGTREFTAAVWYALRTAYSGRQRRTSVSPRSKAARSSSRIPVKSGKHATPRVRPRDSESSFTTPSPTSTIRPHRNSVISDSRPHLKSRSPSPFSLHGPLDTETTSDSDDSRSSSPSSAVSGLSVYLRDSHIDPRLAPSRQTSTPNAAWSGEETLITREKMEAPLSRLRREAAENQWKDEVSNLSLVDSTILHPPAQKQKTRLRSRTSGTGEMGS